jgi:hypothetical protein
MHFDLPSTGPAQSPVTILLSVNLKKTKGEKQAVIATVRRGEKPVAADIASARQKNETLPILNSIRSVRWP